MLLSFAEEHSLHVVDFEALDFRLFVRDPRAAIADQIQDADAVEYQMKHSDIDLEVDRARRCLDHPRITLISRTPSYDDLRRISGLGAQVTCAINGAPLLGEDTYRPHSVVVRDVSEESVTIDDPGPPPRPCWAITRAEFERCWLDPTPNVANLVAVSKSALAWIPSDSSS